MLITSKEVIRPTEFSADSVQVDVTIETRRLYDWEQVSLEEPKPEDFENEKEYVSFYKLYEEQRDLDTIFEKACSCPTIRAVAHYFPEIADIPFAFKDYGKNKTLGEYGDGEGRLRDPKDNTTYFFLNTGVVAHELRHAFHEAQYVFDVKYKLASLRKRIALTRAYEADATVAEITVAAERAYRANDDSTMNAILRLKGYKIPAKAFLAECKKDPEALWNGKAQRAAFFAYLSHKTLSIMRLYDSTACQAMQDIITNGAFKITPATAHFEKIVGENSKINQQTRERTFRTALESLFYMPYENDRGELIDRPHYSSLANDVTLEVLLENMTSKTRDRIQFIEGQMMGLVQDGALSEPA